MQATEEFARLTDPYRRELLAHCYRMLGSIHDAEDLVQETYLRAWRGYDDFESRSSLRTWLYRIATNACLNALESTQRRALPSGLGAPSDDAEGPWPEAPEITWLQPIPDRVLDADPASVAVLRQSTRLAVVAVMQLLPARQRAALLLRDVLGLRAQEVAGLLETSTASVNSSLQRARERLAQVAPAEDDVTEPSATDDREAVERYVTAFQESDLAAMVKLLRDDIVFEMPPHPSWFAGLDAVTRFLETRMRAGTSRRRFVVTRANTEPAVAMYLWRDGAYRAHNIQVLTVRGGRIARVTAFLDVTLFPVFGLPASVP
jgi:RNA polymerase sigma-70 factor, ECF subfamily